MGDYNIIAQFYDSLNREVDYSLFFDFYRAQLKKYNLEPRIVLDIACGTGRLTDMMSRAGYDMIGADISEQMLYIARENCRPEVLLINQGVCELDLFGTVDACYCSLDGFNCIKPDELCAAFSKVSLFTVPGGLFIFDLNSEYKFDKIYAENVYLYDTDEVYCIWQNRYCAGHKSCDFELTFFTRDRDRYIREDEVIRQYSHSCGDVESCLKEAGFELLELTDIAGGQVTESTERQFFTARKL